MARKKKRRIASRGSVNNIILRTLVSGDKYGYEIIKEVEDFSNGKIQLKQPSLYSSLSRFEEKNYVTSYWGDSEIGGRRHYYHLTELGNEYYRKAVLKESDEAEEVDDTLSTDELEVTDDTLFTEEDDDSIDNDDSIANEFQEDALIENDEINITSTPVANIEEMQYTELDETDIPAIADFEQKTDEQIIIPDHNFFKHTPMDTLCNTAETYENNEPPSKTTEGLSSLELNQPAGNIVNDIEEIQSKDINTQSINNDKPWLELSTPTKISNSKISNSKFKTLYTKKPKKVQKVILDRDGIYKLRDEDYVPIKRSNTPVIIDNVGKRTKDNNVFGYTSYTEPKKKDSPSYTELSDEEKRKRNENFLAKFNLLTNSKMKPISTPTPKIEDKKPEIPIDYRGKLNAVIESTILREDEEDPFVELEEENNIYNYDNSNDWTTPQNQDTKSDDLDDDEQIDLEPVEEFETKTTDTQYIENINTFSPNNDIQITKYENKSKAILLDKTYILNNKLKFIFGILMTLIMVAELTIAYLCFKNNNIIFNGDLTVIILGYVIIGIFALCTILPYLFNHNQHKANNFKFKYSSLLGLLTFIVLSILIYCINALAGFELDNFQYFTVKLLVPIILSSNVFVGPLVYGLLNKNKAFYD